MGFGDAISLSEGKAKEAELYLLSAEAIITEVMGTGKYLECSRHD